MKFPKPLMSWMERVDERTLFFQLCISQFLCTCTTNIISTCIIVDGTVVCSGDGSIVHQRRDLLPAIVIDICEGVVSNY